MKVSPFKYSGRKLQFVDQINSLYNNLFFSLDTSELTYVEPYCGSASVFFNLTSEFKKYIISDIDRNVVEIMKAIKNNPYTVYWALYESVKNQFGDIKNSKDAYYAFRNWFNENYWGTCDKVEGLYLQLLFGSCINSMARFGPSGFNQGYGNALFVLSKEEYDVAHIKLQKTEIYNMSFEKLQESILVKYDEHKLFFFFDPPYIKRGAAYHQFDEDEHSKFIKYLNNCKGKWIYTDIYENQVKFPFMILRENMTNTAPNTKKEKLDNKEVAFYKI
jgi:DNA adenine methylase Dam